MGRYSPNRYSSNRYNVGEIAQAAGKAGSRGTIPIWLFEQLKRQQTTVEKPLEVQDSLAVLPKSELNVTDNLPVNVRSILDLGDQISVHMRHFLEARDDLVLTLQRILEIVKVYKVVHAFRKISKFNKALAETGLRVSEVKLENEGDKS